MTQQDDITQRVLTAEQDPINAAILLLTEEADSISDCHTRTPGDWAGEPEAKAHYDHVQAVVDALSKLRAPVAEDDEVKRIRDRGPAYPYTPNTAPPTPLASAPVADLRPHLEWALRRIRTSLDTGDKYEAAQAALDAAVAAPVASAPVAAPSNETLRLAGVIADKIEDGTLFQAGIFSRRELADKVRAVVRFVREASTPVAGEAVYTLRVRGAIQAWTPTVAAFSIPDGEHQLFLSPAAPQASTPVGDERATQEYGSPADVAQRIEQYLAQDGRMNSGTQLLYEAMKALRASQGDRNDG